MFFSDSLRRDAEAIFEARKNTEEFVCYEFNVYKGVFFRLYSSPLQRFIGFICQELRMASLFVRILNFQKLEKLIKALWVRQWNGLKRLLLLERPLP